MTPIAPEITAARERLAGRLGVKPADLRYEGKMYGPDYILLLFTVMNPAHPAFRSTLSVRVEN